MQLWVHLIQSCISMNLTKPLVLKFPTISSCKPPPISIVTGFCNRVVSSFIGEISCYDKI
ncbi:hypothetical protein V6Z12_D02G062200 [Gossypium hirsutum]